MPASPTHKQKSKHSSKSSRNHTMPSNQYSKSSSKREEKPVTADQPKQYCICRSEDYSGFMICCDRCEEWFHGKCIKITEEEAKDIENYYCNACRLFDPTTRAKVLKEEKRRKRRQRSESSTACSSMEQRHAKANHVSPNEQTAEESKSVTLKQTTNVIKKPRGHPCAADSTPTRMIDEQPTVSYQLPELANYACGICKHCRRPACGKCAACLGKTAMPKTCEQRTCLTQIQFGNVQKTERVATSPTVPRTLASSPFSPPLTPPETPPQAAVIAKTEDDSPQPSTSHKTALEKVSPSPHEAPADAPVDAITGDYDLDDQSEDEESQRQCYGPHCCKPALPNSKYCSDECGLQLGLQRILHFMPKRLQDWNSGSKADECNRARLKQIHKLKYQALQMKQEIEDRILHFERLVDIGNKKRINPAARELLGSADEEQSVACVTCGLEVSARTAVKHMEKCYARHESKFNFASEHPCHPRFEDLICDAYNTVSKTHCKRLRVLCPEHNRNNKAEVDEVCGAPLVKNVFSFCGKFCAQPKSSCTQHYAWDRIRRADLDLERLRLLQKIEELSEEEARLRKDMSVRGGLLNMLLHKTTDHDRENSRE